MNNGYRERSGGFLRKIGKSFFSLVVFSFIFCPRALGLGDITELYGIAAYLKPSMRPIISPGIAISLIENRVLLNLLELNEDSPALRAEELRKSIRAKVVKRDRIPKGDIPAIEEANDKIGKLTAELHRADAELGPGTPALKSQKDPVLSLIRTLFHRIPDDDVNLLPTDHENNPLYYLTTSGIGKAINLILGDFTKEEVVEVLSADILKQAKVSGNLKDLKEKQRQLEREATALLDKRPPEKRSAAAIQAELQEARECQKTEKDPTKLEELEAQVKKLSSWLQLQDEISQQNKKLDPYNIEPFVETLIKAVELCERQDSVYPEHFPVQLLMAFALLRSNRIRGELLELWKEMPNVLSETGTVILSPGPAQRDFLNFRFEDRKVETKYATKRFWDFQKMRPEDLFECEQLQALEVYEKQANDVEQSHVFNQYSRKVKFKLHGKEVESTDCCEAAFYNAILLFQSQKQGFGGETATANLLEPKLSTLLQSPDIHWQDPHDPNLRARIKVLSSGIPGLTYYQGNHDLKPSVENFTVLMEHLFRLAPRASASLSTRLKNACNALGTKRKPITCRVEPAHAPPGDGPWDRAKIIFADEFGDRLSIKISPDHCVAVLPQSDFKTGLSTNLKYAFLEHKRFALGKSKLLDEQVALAIPPVIEAGRGSSVESTFQNLEPLLKIPVYRRHLVHLLNGYWLRSPEDYMAYARIIFTHFPETRNLFPMALRALTHLPLDEHWVREIIDVMSPFPKQVFIDAGIGKDWDSINKWLVADKRILANVGMSFSGSKSLTYWNYLKTLKP